MTFFYVAIEKHPRVKFYRKVTDWGGWFCICLWSCVLERPALLRWQSLGGSSAEEKATCRASQNPVRRASESLAFRRRSRWIFPTLCYDCLLPDTQRWVSWCPWKHLAALREWEGGRRCGATEATPPWGWWLSTWSPPPKCWRLVAVTGWILSYNIRRHKEFH